MKALVIYRVDISEISNQGVSKKMQGQLFGLIENGVDVDVIYMNEVGLCKNEVLVKSVGLSWIAQNWFKGVTFYTSINKIIESKLYDIIIIRHHVLLPGFIRMLQKFKLENPSVKIVMDLPTYPYDNEWLGFKGKVLIKIDNRIRKILFKYVDLILHYGKEKELFGIPCLTITNGIIPYRYKHTLKKKKNDEIRLIAVGKWQYWHGLDRLLFGLIDYINNGGEMHVVLDVIGEGPELLVYKSIVREGKIEKYVYFHGNLTGELLDEIFDEADIGIGTLGIHRKGVSIDSSLKHREYCIIGMPFILGCNDLDFPKEVGFVKYFYGNEAIDLSVLIKFWLEVENVKYAEIQNYATKNLSWKKRMKDLLNYDLIKGSVKFL